MKKTLLFALCAVCITAGCSKEEPVTSETPSSAKQVTLTLGYADEDTKAYLADGTDVSTQFEVGDVIKVNGVECTVALNGDGKPSVTVTEADSYEAWYPANLASAPETPGDPIHPGSLSLFKLQPVQFVYYDSDGNITSMGKFNPLWADHSINTSSSSLTFKHVGGILKMTISGPSTTKIETIKIENKAAAGAANALAGNFVQSGDVLVPQSSSDLYYNYVVLNCGTGVALSESGTPFYIYLPAGTYSSGFKITISDAAHKSMIIDSETSRTITSGKILNTPVIAYSTAANLIWSDYFDTFAWGDNYMTGVKGWGAGNNGTEAGLYSVTRDDAATVTIADGYYHNNRLSGDTQAALALITYRHNMATYNPANGSTRFARVYEAPGYMSCGYAATRCLVDFPKLPSVPASGNVKISFDVARNIDDANQDGINFQISVGTIVSVTKDNGTPYTATDAAAGITMIAKKATFNTTFIPNGTKGWSHIEVMVSGATTGTYPMFFQTNGSGNRARFYVDNFVVESVD